MKEYYNAELRRFIASNVLLSNRQVNVHLTHTQKELFSSMRDGAILWSFDRGDFELAGRPFWPRQKRTVCALLRAGMIVYDGKETSIQRECGMRTLGLSLNREIDRLKGGEL